MQTVLRKTTRRDSNIELLRLVLMFMVVVNHAFMPGLKLGSLLYSSCPIIHESDLFPSILMTSFCIVAVNTFILISGYYGINTTKSKFLYLLCQMIICFLLFSAPVYIFHGGTDLNISRFLFLSHSRDWFLVDYLILMIFAPAINLLFEKTGPQMQCIFTFSLLFISCYLGFLWHFEANVNGFTVIQFLTMYSVGMYIKKKKFNLNRAPAIITYFLCSICITALMMFFHKTGHDSWAWIMTYYNNPILIISSIAVFFCFKNTELQSTRINRISSSSLMIYLFSGSAIVELFYYPIIQTSYSSYGRLVFLLILVYALLLSGLAIGIDKLFVSRIVNYLHRKLMNIQFTLLRP